MCDCRGILTMTMFAVFFDVATFLLLIVFSSAADIGSVTGIKEYCERDVFRAHCQSPDEVVLIMHARYGRMRDGRCITNTYGALGCFTDVRPLLESACSGRRSCETTVATLVPDHSQPCPSDFRSYLEASYECIKVISMNHIRQCTSTPGPTTVQLTPDMSRGYISSVVTEETGCGSVDSPWKLVAPPGRRLQLYLLDFTNHLQQRQREQQPGTCQVYAVIREENASPGNSQTVCGEPNNQASRSETLIHSSVAESIEVRLVVNGPRHKHTQSVPNTANQVTPPVFLIKFEVSGCPDPPMPKNGAMQRTDNDVIMWCNTSMTSHREQWHLTCEGNQWIGQSKDCTVDRTSVAGNDAIFGLEIFSNLQGMSIVIVLIIALTIGVSIAALGAVYLRSKLRERREAMLQQQRPAAVLSTEQYDYNYRLQHSIDATLSKLNEQQTQQFLVGVPNSAHHPSAAATAVVSVSSPYERDSFNSSENEYYKSWQTQKRFVPTQQMTACTDSTLIGCSDDHVVNHVVDHIYESPDFARKDFKTFNKS